MIATNFRRYAEAMLHQLELPFDALRTVQALSAPAFARLLSAAKRGLLNATNWTKSTKTKRAKQPTELVRWTQLKLWLYAADQVELALS